MGYYSNVDGKTTFKAKGNISSYAKDSIKISSHEKINIKGEEKGISFNSPKTYKTKTDIKVTKVEGPFDDKGKLVKVVKIGEFYTYKATLSRKPNQFETHLLKWATKNDDGKITKLNDASANNQSKDDKIFIAIAINHDCEKAKVYAYFNKPLKDISVEVKLPSLQHVIVIGTQKHRGDSSIVNPKSWILDVGAGSKLMFAHQALRRMRLNNDIKFSVLMCEDGYKASHLKAVKDAVVKLYGGKFYQVTNAQQIINYLNTGDKDNSANISEERKAGQVKQLFFYSHGIVEKIALGMGLIGDDSDYAFGKQEVAKLNKEAFMATDSHIYSFACRTGIGNPDVDQSVYDTKTKSSGMVATPMGLMPRFETEKIQLPLYSAQSIAQKLSNQTGATTYAYLRRTDYEDTLYTSDELAFSDYMKKREDMPVELSPKRYGDKYKYLLNEKYALTEEEKKRWAEWKKIESNYKKIDDAWFDPDGARHNVKAAKTPEGVPAEMQTFKPLK